MNIELQIVVIRGGDSEDIEGLIPSVLGKCSKRKKRGRYRKRNSVRVSSIIEGIRQEIIERI